MSMDDERARPHSEVVDTDLDDDELVLLHLSTSRYYSLNSTGALIFRLLKEDLTLGQVSRRLQEEFHVDGHTADRAVRDLVDELAQQDLVRVTPGEETDPARGGEDTDR